jgi:hypothetical protein
MWAVFGVRGVGVPVGATVMMSGGPGGLLGGAIGEDAVGAADADEIDVAAEDAVGGAVATDVHDVTNAVGDADADEIDVAFEDGVGVGDVHGGRDSVGDDFAGREGAEPHAATTISRAQRIPWAPSRTTRAGRPH